MAVHEEHGPVGVWVHYLLHHSLSFPMESCNETLWVVIVLFRVARFLKTKLLRVSIWPAAAMNS